MKKNLFIKYLSFSLVLTALASCGGKTETQVESATPIKVKVESIKSGEIERAFSFPATLESERRITLSTKVMGKITYLPYEQGTNVQAGQTLLRIDAGDLSAKRAQVTSNLVEANSMLKNIETNYNRMKDLFGRGSATQKEFEDIATAYESAKAKVNAVQEMEKELADVLSYASLSSPVNGFIAQKFVQLGDMASPAMPLLIVEGGGITKATAKVSESDVSNFKVGEEVTIRIDAADQTLKGKIEQVSQSGTMGSRQYDVKIKLLNSKSNSLKSGMFANVELRKQGGEGISISENLLVKRGDLEGIYVLSAANESLLRWVRTGKRAEGQIEILSGLSDGEKLIVQAEGKLQDGKKVEVMQ